MWQTRCFRIKVGPCFAGPLLRYGQNNVRPYQNRPYDNPTIQMQKSKDNVWKIGEEMARKYLEKQGYK
ncbi:MAG: hypothetical protein ABII95_00705, partial [Patescibacteria group bacterium]